MNSGLDQNQSVLAVDVLARVLEMLADRHCLLDQMVKVLGDLWGHTLKAIDP